MFVGKHDSHCTYNISNDRCVCKRTRHRAERAKLGVRALMCWGAWRAAAARRLHELEGSGPNKTANMALLITLRRPSPLARYLFVSCLCIVCISSHPRLRFAHPSTLVCYMSCWPQRLCYFSQGRKWTLHPRRYAIG